MPVEISRQLARCPQCDNVRHGFGPGALPSLLPAAYEKGGKAHAFAYVERADPFGRMKLVAGKGKEINRPVLQAYGKLANRLHAVNMKERVGIFAHDAPCF